MSRNKCNKKRFCGVMEAALTDSGSPGRRMFVAPTVDRDTGKEGIRMAVQFTGKAKDYAWMIYCPFCGVKFSEVL
jgi:hypothetical protein